MMQNKVARNFPRLNLISDKNKKRRVTSWLIDPSAKVQTGKFLSDGVILERRSQWILRCRKVFNKHSLVSMFPSANNLLWSCKRDEEVRMKDCNWNFMNLRELFIFSLNSCLRICQKLFSSARFVLVISATLTTKTWSHFYFQPFHRGLSPRDTGRWMSRRFYDKLKFGVWFVYEYQVRGWWRA